MSRKQLSIVTDQAILVCMQQVRRIMSIIDVVSMTTTEKITITTQWVRKPGQVAD